MLCAFLYLSLFLWICRCMPRLDRLWHGVVARRDGSACTGPRFPLCSRFLRALSRRSAASAAPALIPWSRAEWLTPCCAAVQRRPVLRDSHCELLQSRMAVRLDCATQSGRGSDERGEDERRSDKRTLLHSTHSQ